MKSPIGAFTVIKPSPQRQFVIDAFTAISGGHPMTALLELDVTEALAAITELQNRGRRVSLFAFIVHAIAVAISEHPEMNQVRHGRCAVRFDDIDISVPVEIVTPEGTFPQEVMIRRAQDRSVFDIYAEIENMRNRYESSGKKSDNDLKAQKIARAISWLPSFVRVGILRFLMSSAFRVKAHAGTVLVTSIGKFAEVPGFPLTFSTGPRAAVFAVGSVVRKPWVVDEKIVVRSILGLSIMVDHDFVDGSPAARFANRLKQLIQSAEGLSQKNFPVQGKVAL